MRYEPIRNEDGDIPYGKEAPLEDYCYKEIQQCDILVCIIGNKYGSESQKDKYSVTQQELKTAIEQGKQVYIFIEKNVSSEYETYLLNKDKDIRYKFVDNPQIYKFIEEIRRLRVNNNIKSFESTSDVTVYLREQFAGLFKRFIDEQNKVKELNTISQLEKTVQTLEKLVELLAEKNSDQSEKLNEILLLNNPLIDKIKDSLNIPYNFYISGISDLNSLLHARGFRRKDEDSYFWTKESRKENKRFELTLSEDLFSEDGRLKYVNPREWKDYYFSFQVVPIVSELNDLPF